MKITAFFAAGALAVATLVSAAPAEAQRYGWDGPRGGHGHGYGRGGRWDGPRHGYRGHRGQYGYGGGYRGHRGYGRSRVVCRFQRGYYGPVRRCRTIYR